MIPAGLLRVGNRVVIDGRCGCVERTSMTVFPDTGTVSLGLRDSDGVWWTAHMDSDALVMVVSRPE